MNKKIYIIILLVITLVLNSCGNESKNIIPEEKIKPVTFKEEIKTEILPDDKKPRISNDPFERELQREVAQMMNAPKPPPGSIKPIMIIEANENKDTNSDEDNNQLMEDNNNLQINKGRKFIAIIDQPIRFIIDNGTKKNEGCEKIIFPYVPEGSIENMQKNKWLHSLEECVVIDLPIGIQYAFSPITSTDYITKHYNEIESQGGYSYKQPVQIEFSFQKIELSNNAENIFPFDISLKPVDRDYTEKPFYILMSITDSDKLYQEIQKQDVCMDIDIDDPDLYILKNQIQNSEPDCNRYCMQREICLSKLFQTQQMQEYYSEGKDEKETGPILKEGTLKGKTFLEKHPCLFKGGVPVYKGMSRVTCLGVKP